MTERIDIPQYWQIVVSSEILDIRDGTHDTPKYVKENGVPLITSKNLKENEIDFNKVSFISYEDHIEISKRSKVDEGDILFAMIGTIGNPAIIKSNTNFSIKNVGLFKRNEKVILSSFLVNFLRSRTFEKQLSERKLLKGTTQRFIPLGNLRAINIPLPPINEQQQIVSKIEELFSELDKGIEELKTAQQQLKVYRQAVLKWAFEGKLTNEDVKEGELPKGWKWVNIQILLSDIKKGMATGPFGTMLKKHEHTKEGVPVLGIENIGEGVFQMPNKIFITKDKANELKNFRVNENDIIISRSGTVGEICLVPMFMNDAIISTNLIKVSLNKNVVDPKYFVYLFQGGQVRQQVFKLCKGSSRAFLNQTILSSLDFPYCSLDEQQQIVQEIESRLSVCDKIEETITNSLNSQRL